MPPMKRRKVTSPEVSMSLQRPNDEAQVMQGHTRLIVARHAERLDRSLEKMGKSWIYVAKRPQDPPLSKLGEIQATKLAEYLSNQGITKIVTSPLIRTVQTADIIAKHLGLDDKSILCEQGLCEHVASMRNPKVPIFLHPIELWGHFSEFVDPEHESYRAVQHKEQNEVFVRNLERDAVLGKKKSHGMINDDPEHHNMCEIHPNLPLPTKEHSDMEVSQGFLAITESRVQETIDCVLSASKLESDTLLFMCHGASAQATIRYLTKDPEFKNGGVASCAILSRDNATGRWGLETNGMTEEHIANATIDHT